MPVIQECLHSPTKTCGFNCWYFWNVGKSPALRRQEIAEACYGRVLAWQGVTNPTATSSVEEHPDSNDAEGSETLPDAFESTGERSSQNVALELADQLGVAVTEEQSLHSPTEAESADGPKDEFHEPEPEVSNHSMQSVSALDYGTEKLEGLGGGAEVGGVEGHALGPFVKEECIETEELRAKVGTPNIETERGSPSEEAVGEGNEEWEL
ncbi:hypothetical protein VE04_01700 [Pseudogymnoascus sp. 24MN13]|nr:hypothetical protein VE04_01700 [Pseudogymnoascus sp. 24MN13]